MSYTNLISPSEISESFGGKANNLIILQDFSLNIPQWVVIPKEVLADQLSSYTSLEDIKNQLNNLVVPSDLMQDMELHFGEKYKEKKYAVRSSSIDEDGEKFSFAGQYETVLNVNYDELVEGIKEVWKSVGSKHLLAYRNSLGLASDFNMAVIIQEMIPSDVSGVAFGLDPVSGDADKKVIAAVPGLGEGLVSGRLNADNFTISPQGIEKKLYHREQHTATQEPETTLSENQLNELVELLDALNHKTGIPQDVEFAYYNDQLYVLQSRPITTWSQKDKGAYLLWDNSNIVESYPGITTPLTFSFISKMYTQVYSQFSELLGVSSHRISKNIDVYQNTLGLVRGRVYYNLLSWYKMLAMIPGYAINASFMETMMGVKEKFELGDEFKMSKSKAWFRITLMVFRMIYLQLTLPIKRRKFQKYLNQQLAVYNAHDYTSMPIEDIIKHYKIFETELLKEWKVPLINDFFSMIWFGLLKKKTSQLVPDMPNLHNDLLCGSQDIISVQPIHRTFALADKIKTSKSLLEIFKFESVDTIWEALKSENYTDVSIEIDRYLADFGERCIGELKLETTSYTQDPKLFIKILKSYITNDISSKINGGKIQNEIRENAEKTIHITLKGKWFSRTIFSYILDKARDLVSNRENLRYERTRAFGVVRKMFSAIGDKLNERNIIQNTKDIFYLELQEVLALSDNSTADDISQIQQRKAEFEGYKLQAEPQERFYTYGYNFDDKYIYSDEKIGKIEGDLQGIGCCPGQIRGRVQVVEDPESIDSLKGDILVTKSTDPGWVTLFPSASAIIVERGSLLSHSAIVSREMGIPCIVSVDGLLRSLKTGDEVYMDGSTGVIKLINRKLQ